MSKDMRLSDAFLDGMLPAVDRQRVEQYGKPAPVERTAEEPKLPDGWGFDDADDAVRACMRIAFSDTADDAEMDTDMKRSCRIVIPTGLAIAILRRAGWTVTR